MRFDNRFTRALLILPLLLLSACNNGERAEEVHVFGDSVASGVGTGDGFVHRNGEWKLEPSTDPDDDEENDPCGFREMAWPAELSKIVDPPVNNFACDQAKLERSEGDELQVVGKEDVIQKPGKARVAIVQLGANDLHYDQRVTTCYTTDGCEKLTNDFAEQLAKFKANFTEWLEKLTDIYDSVVVVTYYNPLDDREGCREYRFQVGPFQLELDRNERGLLVQQLQDLNETLKSVAVKTGAKVVDIELMLQGHSLCADEPWVLGPSIASISGHSSSAAPLHLTAKGQKAVAEQVAPVIKDLLERS